MGVRLAELDVLRGLLLVNIMFNHMPGTHNLVTSQTLGFVSSAEGFFLLSSYLLGRINARREVEGRPIFERLGSRIWLIYLAQVLVFSLVMLVIGIGLGHIPNFAYIVHPYLEQPAKAVISGLLLLYQPPLLDILPRYIFFLAISPLAWWLAKRGHWLLVLAPSLSLWLWAQFHPMNETLEFFKPGLLVHWGSFNIFAWQLLWIFGLGFGAWHWHHPGLRLPNWLVWLAGVLVAGFLGWRYGFWKPDIDKFWSYMLTEKWFLAPLRVVNLAALVVMVLAFAQSLRHLLGPLAFLSILGRQSLLVFSLHAFLGLLLAGWAEYSKPSEAMRLLAILAQVGIIYLWACRLECRKTKGNTV
jgi:hypothetical protein